MYRFNVPPSWPLPANFTPPTGWQPDPSFTPEPDSWKFWILDNYDPKLPTVSTEDRGAFTSQPAEITAREAEQAYFNVKQTANLAYDRASSSRRRLQEAKSPERFFKTHDEKQVESLISALATVRIKAEQARDAADNQYRVWKQNQSPRISVTPPPVPVYNAPRVSMPTPTTQPAPTPPVINTPQVTQSLSNPPAAPQSPFHPVTPVNPSQSNTGTENLTTPANPNSGNAFSGGNNHLNQSPSQDSLGSDEFWNGFIQKVKQINFFNLSKTKRAILSVLEQAKQDTRAYENAVRGNHWTNVQEKLRKTEEEIAYKHRQADADIANKLNQSRAELNRVQQEIDSIVLGQVSYYDYYHPASTSVQLRGELQQVQQRAKDMIRDKTATFASTNFTFNNSEAQGRKFVKDLSTLMLTAYNQEAENAIAKATGGSRDIQTALNRLEKANQKIKKMGTMIQMEVNPEYHRLRLKEIELAFSYKEQLEAEKELERENKARLREEARVLKEAEDKQRELERQEREAERAVQLKLEEMERQRVAKLQNEENHYQNALNNAEEIQRLNDNDRIIAELKAKLEEIRQAKERNNQTIANTKAGYVYVISNIGAFGEGILKIGLTRRQEPLDRVKELSSASVPFPFDVHAIHFSADAVQLETALHQHFASKKVNLINQRKEYFHVTPEEVKDAMQRLSNGALMQFNVEAPAAQWRQTQQVRSQNN